MQAAGNVGCAGGVNAVTWAMWGQAMSSKDTRDFVGHPVQDRHVQGHPVPLTSIDHRSAHTGVHGSRVPVTGVGYQRGHDTGVEGSQVPVVSFGNLGSHYTCVQGFQRPVTSVGYQGGTETGVEGFQIPLMSIGHADVQGFQVPVTSVRYQGGHYIGVEGFQIPVDYQVGHYTGVQGSQVPVTSVGYERGNGTCVEGFQIPVGYQRGNDTGVEGSQIPIGYQVGNYTGVQGSQVHVTSVGYQRGNGTYVEGSHLPVYYQVGNYPGMQGSCVPLTSVSYERGNDTRVEGSQVPVDYQLGHYPGMQGSCVPLTSVSYERGNDTRVEGSQVPVDYQLGHYPGMQGSCVPLTSVSYERGNDTGVECSQVPVDYQVGHDTGVQGSRVPLTSVSYQRGNDTRVEDSKVPVGYQIRQDKGVQGSQGPIMSVGYQEGHDTAVQGFQIPVTNVGYQGGHDTCVEGSRVPETDFCYQGGNHTCLEGFQIPVISVGYQGDHYADVLGFQAPFTNVGYQGGHDADVERFQIPVMGVGYECHATDIPGPHLPLMNGGNVTMNYRPQSQCLPVRSADLGVRNMETESCVHLDQRHLTEQDSVNAGSSYWLPGKYGAVGGSKGQYKRLVEAPASQRPTGNQTYASDLLWQMTPHGQDYSVDTTFNMKDILGEFRSNVNLSMTSSVMSSSSSEDLFFNSGTNPSKGLRIEDMPTKMRTEVKAVLSDCKLKSPVVCEGIGNTVTSSSPHEALGGRGPAGETDVSEDDSLMKMMSSMTLDGRHSNSQNANLVTCNDTLITGNKKERKEYCLEDDESHADKHTTSLGDKTAESTLHSVHGIQSGRHYPDLDAADVTVVSRREMDRSERGRDEIGRREPSTRQDKRAMSVSVNRSNNVQAVGNFNYNKNIYKMSTMEGYQNIRTQSLSEIASQEKLFVQTKAFDEVWKVSEKESVIFIVGPPGSGKTMVAKAVLLQLQKEQNFEPLILLGVQEMREMLNVDEKQGIFIKNTFGISDFDQVKVNSLREYFASVSVCVSDNKKFIFTCNNRIFQKCRPHLKLEKFFSESSVVDLQRVGCLTLVDKKSILYKHLKQRDVILKDDLVEEIAKCANSSTPVFPKCCQFFAKSAYLHDKGKAVTFFQMPVLYYKLLVELLRQKDDKSYFIALLLVMVLGELQDSFLKGVLKDEKAQKVLAMLPYEVTLPELDLATRDLLNEGLYLKRSENNNSYIFIDSCVCDAVAIVFGTEYPKQLLQNCSGKFLCERVLVNSLSQEENDEGYFILGIDHFDFLSERFVTEIRSGFPYLVTRHPAFSDGPFINSFANYCATRADIDTILESKDSHHQFPLLFWSSWNEKEHLFRWIFDEHNNRKLPITKEDIKNITRACCISGNVRSLEIVLNFERSCSDMVNDCATISLAMPTSSEASLTASSVERVVQVGGMLHTACLHGHLPVVELLVTQFQSSVELHDDYGNTPLTIAAKHGHCNIVKFLIDHGAKGNMWHQMKKMAIHEACENGRTEVVKVLLTAWRRLVNIIGPAPDDRFPIHYACASKEPKLVKLLVEKGADPKCVDSNNNTAFHTACSRPGGLRVLKELKPSLQDLKLQNKFHATCLHLACEFGRPAMVQFLLRKGADVKALNDKQQTPLHVACQSNQVEIAGKLLKNGADVFALDITRTPALKLTTDEKLKKLLIQHMSESDGDHDSP
ncbi:uncharacterized protein [Haliotis asinina]|uniref:uncharacterized protein n=1 Tax=Haliotis asinina TaxID=109174 RepID=UPI0035325CFC